MSIPKACLSGGQGDETSTETRSRIRTACLSLSSHLQRNRHLRVWFHPEPSYHYQRKTAEDAANDQTGPVDTYLKGSGSGNWKKGIDPAGPNPESAVSHQIASRNLSSIAGNFRILAWHPDTFICSFNMMEVLYLRQLANELDRTMRQ